MKQSPEEQQITDRMQPGVYCRDGFLGTDSRPLGEILDTDGSAVEALGATHERIAAKMTQVLDHAVAAFGAPVRIGEHLSAEFGEAMGRIPSPFGDGVFRKGEVELTDARSGEKFRFSPLSVHLIAAHGFYQGRGSRYRIDPEKLCELFDISPGGERPHLG